MVSENCFIEPVSVCDKMKFVQLNVAAMAPHYNKLTPEELARNKHGPMHLYSYTVENLGIYEAPGNFPSIMNHAKVQLINRQDIFVLREKLVHGLCPGVKLDIYSPGFPTLKYINHTSNLDKAKVSLFICYFYNIFVEIY